MDSTYTITCDLRERERENERYHVLKNMILAMQLEN